MSAIKAHRCRVLGSDRVLLLQVCSAAAAMIFASSYFRIRWPVTAEAIFSIAFQPRPPLAGCETEWMSTLGKYGKQVYAQHGEDGILRQLSEGLSDPARDAPLRLVNKYYVEFGVEDGSERNTRWLEEESGWGGLLMDGSDHSKAHYKAPNLQREFMLPNNIVSLFEKYKVPKKFGLWSLDLDSFDVFIYDRILSAGYRPDIMVVEVNAQYGPKACMTVCPPAEVGATTIAPDRTVAYGGSSAIFAALGKKYGYTMVHCEDRGINCFLVRSALLTPSEARCARPAEELYHPRQDHWSCMGASAAPMWEFDCAALASDSSRSGSDMPLETKGPAYTTHHTSRLTLAPCVFHPVWWLLFKVVATGVLALVGLAVKGPDMLGSKERSERAITGVTLLICALVSCAIAQQIRDSFWFAARPAASSV